MLSRRVAREGIGGGGSRQWDKGHTTSCSGASQFTSGHDLWVKASVAGLMLLMAACQSSATATPPTFIRADSVVVETLAATQVSALPSGQLYFLVSEFRQPPHSEFGSTLHDAGFIYMAAGTQLFVPLQGDSVLIDSGEAYFQESIAHHHQNPDATPNDWYHLAVWSTAAQAQPPVNPLAQKIFVSSDLPSGTLPSGPASETLRLITVGSSGHTEPYRRGGVEVMVVLQGSLGLHSAGQPTRTLGRDEGAMVLPGYHVQETNAGQAELVYLSFVVTPIDQPFEVPVSGTV
jgi:hypothetical protein